MNKEAITVTRADAATPLQKDRYVTVYTFQNMGDDIAATNYQTLESGVLTPVSGSGLSLPSGTYDFYALSIGNQSVLPPTVTNFDTGFTSSTLSNGVDYLSCVMEKETVSGATSFDLNFNHAASQVIVIIGSSAATTTIDSINTASISAPSTTSEYLDIYTGIINPSHTLSGTIDMAITDSICQQILLPLGYSGSLNMDFSAYVNGQSTPMAYSVGIPLINSQLAAGSSYVYKVLLNEDKVTIANATVNPWTEVNETGTPLTPVPQ